MNSKEKIIEKYIELVLKKKTPDISVTELCEETGISRNTFYHYFQDRYSVVEAIFINDIEEPMKMGFEMEIHSEIETSIMYRNFLKKKDFYMIVMREEGRNTLFENIIARIQKFNTPIFENVVPDKKRAEYLSYKYSSTQAMLIKKWMSDGMKESPEFMADIYFSELHDYFYFEKVKL